MEPTSASNAAKFVGTVAQFGGQLSRIIHDFITLEDPYCPQLCGFLGHVGGTVHALNQVGKLLGDHAALKDDEKARALFRQDGVEYVAVLAEECSVALCRANAMIGGSVPRGRDLCNYANWPSSTAVDDKGQKTFVVPPLDETEFFRQLMDTKWYKQSVRLEIGRVSDRLELLQVSLVLVVQVLTVRDMTTKIPSGCGDLKSIVQYHSRIERAADLAGIPNSGHKNRYRSRSSSLSYSSSDSDTDFSERPRRRRNVKPVVIKRSPPPPPPPGARGPPLFNGRVPNPPPAPFYPIQGAEIVNVQCGPPKDTHPPSYTESATLNADGSVTVDAKPDLEKVATVLESSKLPSATVVPENTTKTEEENKTAKSPIELASPPSVAPGELLKVPRQPVPNQARLLNSLGGFGNKIKTLFRSKSSLEAEMKRTLADDNASLAAYIIQRGEFFKVPHSAFHSLEYTHIRTILSQLQDNTWFKTFSDLGDLEHDALDDLGRRRMEKGKWLQRELVVLKVLQQNKLNAWVRVLESCMGLDEFLPQHENGRIILAILRDTECENSMDDITIIAPEKKIIVDSCAPQRKDPIRINEPKIEIIDSRFPSPSHPGPAPRMGRPPPTQWSGLGGVAPPPPGAGNSLPYMSCQRADVTPQVPLNETSAREQLTTYKAYTLRPVPLQTSPTDPAPPSRPTWTRCFVTHEHEMKSVLQDRVAAFNRRGESIIDLKLQLTEPQSAQLSRLIDESNRLESNFNFEFKIVELSMVDREHGLVRRQTKDSNVDVMHIVLQRSPKEHVNAMNVYNIIHGPPPFRPMPRPGPPPVAREPVIIYERKPKKPVVYRRGRYNSDYSTSSDSDSDSDSTILTDSSVGNRRKGGKGKKKSVSSDSDSDDDEKPRWKKDPVTVKFDKVDRKKDIVELLLHRWTLAGEGKEGIEEKVEDTKKADKKADKKKKKKKGKYSKKTSRRGKKYYGDSDSSASASLADD